MEEDRFERWFQKFHAVFKVCSFVSIGFVLWRHEFEKDRVSAGDSKSIADIVKEIVDKEGSSFPSWIRKGKVSIPISSADDIKMILRHISLPRALDEFNNFMKIHKSQSQSSDTTSSSTDLLDFSDRSLTVLTTDRKADVEQFFSSITDGSSGLYRNSMISCALTFYD